MTAKAKAAAPAAPKIEDVMAMSIEVPTAVREFAEKGLEQAKDNYAKMKAAAEEATDAVEDTFSTASKGVADFNLRAIDMAKDNANAGFDFFKSLVGVKTVSEAIELQTNFARGQYENSVSQAKELTEFAGDVAKKSVKPVADNVQKAFKDFKLPA